MNGRWQAHREALAHTAREMARLGLALGAEGNASLRLPPGEEAFMLITPRAKDYASLAPEDLVAVDRQLEPVEGERVPSSEAFLHLCVYEAREDVGAVLHTHSPWATALAVAGLPLPPVVDETALLVGGEVALARYAFSGSEELARHAVEALGERNAVLLSHHGVVCVGTDLAEALTVALAVERSAQVYITARLLGGGDPIPPEALAAALEAFRMRRHARRG